MIMDRCRWHYIEVLPIFYHVFPEEVRNQTGSFKEPFDVYEERREDPKVHIDMWREALKDVGGRKGIYINDESWTPEAEGIPKIVEMLGTILTPKLLAVASYTVGVESRVKDIDRWLKDPADVPVGVICGMRGIGKTTIAKVAYNLNFASFEGSCFLANIRQVSVTENGLLHLQNQLLSNITNRKGHTNYGIIQSQIQHAISRKRILVILDDVDEIEQIDALISSPDLLAEGSKIVITTSREGLLNHQEHNTFRINLLDDQESLELFCWHAFSDQDCSTKGVKRIC